MPITRGRPRSGQRSYPDRLDGASWTAGVCVLASVMAHVDVTVVSARATHSLPISGPLQAVVSPTMTGYMLALAGHCGILTAGWAADRFGTRRPWPGIGVHLGSLLCAVAPNILLLIIFRVVQGFGGGMLTPVSFGHLAREAGPKRLGRDGGGGHSDAARPGRCGPILGGWLISLRLALDFLGQPAGRHKRGREVSLARRCV
ncbi:MFS transporter [Mycobacterium tuberculosis]